MKKVALRLKALILVAYILLVIHSYKYLVNALPL